MDSFVNPIFTENNVIRRIQLVRLISFLLPALFSIFYEVMTNRQQTRMNTWNFELMIILFKNKIPLFKNF